jgi:hypothetical protein
MTKEISLKKCSFLLDRFGQVGYYINMLRDTKKEREMFEDDFMEELVGYRHDPMDQFTDDLMSSLVGWRE